MKCLVLSLCFVCALHPVTPAPRPQLTEEEFNARARSLDIDFDHHKYMIEGYSQVRRQGGRAYQEPIKFPTLTVKSPNQLPVEGRNKVKVSLANPVYKDELDSIAQQINLINEKEAERIEEEKALEELEELAEEIAQQIVEEATEQIFQDGETTTEIELIEDEDYETTVGDNGFEIVEVTTRSEDNSEATTEIEEFSEEPVPTTQTLQILEVTNLDKTEVPVIQLSDGDQNMQVLQEILSEIDEDKLNELVNKLDVSALEPEMSLDIDLSDEIQISPLQTEELLIEEVTTSLTPTLQIKEI